MNHETKQFIFCDSDGKEIKVTSKKYSFKLQGILEKRFGKDALEKYNKTGILDADITLENAIQDMPKLLVGKIDKIDFAEEYDEIISVYTFFLRYKKNAFLRQLQSDREMLASNLEILTTTLNSMPKDILKTLKSKVFPNT